MALAGWLMLPAAPEETALRPSVLSLNAVKCLILKTSFS